MEQLSLLSVKALTGGGGGASDITKAEVISRDNNVLQTAKRYIDEKVSRLIEVEENQTVHGYSVPKLTAENITTIHNSVVAGIPTFVADATGEYTYYINQADGNDEELYVVLTFCDVMILTYKLAGDTVQTTYKEFGGGEPAAYLKSIEKNAENQTITVTDKDDNVVSFEYGKGEGTSDYESLINKPQIGGVELSGDKAAEDLGLLKKEGAGTVHRAYTVLSTGETEMREVSYVPKERAIPKYNETGQLKSNDPTVALEVVNKQFLDAEMLKKQDALVSGVNIKTINNESVLGEGNIEIEDETPYWYKHKKLDYLYEIGYFDLDYDFAKDYFKKYEPSNVGACSSIAKNGVLARNYDWLYNEEVSFIVQTPHTLTRYASFGVASGVFELTREFVESGEISDAYKVLPFFMNDGVNEHGLSVSTNVTPDEKGDNKQITPTGSALDTICTLMLPRYILDNFKTAEEAISYLTEHVALYTPTALLEMGFNQHFIITDSEKTYIIEFNEGAYVVRDDINYLTNFYAADVNFNSDGTVYTPADVPNGNKPSDNRITAHGQGLERWNIIAKNYDDLTIDIEDIKSLLGDLKYTNTYSRLTDPFWYSECLTATVDNNNPPSAFEDIVESMITEYERRTRDGATWESVHSTIYDYPNGKFYVCSEEDEWLEYNLWPTSTNDYEDLINKPKIGGVELTGNKSVDDIGALPKAGPDTVHRAYTVLSTGVTEMREVSYVPKERAIPKYNEDGQLRSNNPTANLDVVNKQTFDASLSAKQDTLVSGTNIKTINGSSVLGEGDITVSGEPAAYLKTVTKDTENKTITITDKSDNEVTFEYGSGGEGTTDYEDLINKPKINNVELVGNIDINPFVEAPSDDFQYARRNGEWSRIGESVKFVTYTFDGEKLMNGDVPLTWEELYEKATDNNYDICINYPDCPFEPAPVRMLGLKNYFLLEGQVSENVIEFTAYSSNFRNIIGADIQVTFRVNHDRFTETTSYEFINKLPSIWAVDVPGLIDTIIQWITPMQGTSLCYIKKTNTELPAKLYEINTNAAEGSWTTEIDFGRGLFPIVLDNYSLPIDAGRGLTFRKKKYPISNIQYDKWLRGTSEDIDAGLSVTQEPLKDNGESYLCFSDHAETALDQNKTDDVVEVEPLMGKQSRRFSTILGSIIAAETVLNARVTKSSTEFLVKRSGSVLLENGNWVGIPYYRGNKFIDVEITDGGITLVTDGETAISKGFVNVEYLDLLDDYIIP